MSDPHDNKQERGRAAMAERRAMILRVQEALAKDPHFLASDERLRQALEAVCQDNLYQIDIDTARMEQAGGSFLLEVLDHATSPDLVFKLFGSISLHNLGHVFEDVADSLAKEHCEKTPGMRYEDARIEITAGAICRRIALRFAVEGEPPARTH